MNRFKEVHVFIDMVQFTIMLQRKGKWEVRSIDSFDDLINDMDVTEDIMIISKNVKVLNQAREKEKGKPVAFEVIIS